MIGEVILSQPLFRIQVSFSYLSFHIRTFCTTEDNSCCCFVLDFSHNLRGLNTFGGLIAMM